METTQTIDLGVIKFMPLASFLDPQYGGGRESEKAKWLRELLAEPQSTSAWPRVRKAIRRGGLFVVETAMPSFTAMLHFSPEHPEAGKYEIHHLPRGPVITGRTVEVVAIAADETDYRMSMLAPFTFRYRVRTLPDTRPQLESMWLVGLKTCPAVPELSDLGDEEPREVNG